MLNKWITYNDICKTGQDQGGLSNAIEYLNINPFILSKSWNFRSGIVTEGYGPIKIWHSHNKIKLDKINNKGFFKVLNMVNEIGKNGGHWSKEEHLKQNGLHTFNNGVCDWVINNFKPNNVLEFGCGMGYYSSYFSRKGVDTVHGVEPKFMGNELFDEENNCLQFNFDITVDDIPEKIKNTKYDVLFTLEVMEHIDRKFHDKIFDFFTEKSDIIVFFGC